MLVDIHPLELGVDIHQDMALVQEDTLLIQVQILVVVPEMAVELDVVDPLDMVESQQVMNLLADLLL